MRKEREERMVDVDVDVCVDFKGTMLTLMLICMVYTDIHTLHIPRTCIHGLPFFNQERDYGRFVKEQRGEYVKRRGEHDGAAREFFSKKIKKKGI